MRERVLRASRDQFARPLLLACLIVSLPHRDAKADGPPNRNSGSFVPLLSNDEAWKCLPPTDSGGGQPLPTWARALAATLPRTTAAMLELDLAYRTSDALEPRLSAAIRLAVARAVGSEYGRAYAEADLRLGGLDRAAIDRLAGDPAQLPEPDRAVLAFAFKLSTAGYSTTDAEVADLVAKFGEPRVVAIVLQVAFANFLDRLAMSLGLEIEPGGPVPSVVVRFSSPSNPEIPPAPRPPIPSSPQSVSTSLPGVDWASLSFAQLQEKLKAQRERKPRVSIPTWEEFRSALPEGLYPRSRPLQIRWSLLVSGRQPKLGPAWIKCLRVFEAESKQDRVFEESLFWVVTRSLRCFYCMGHCEMLLEEAGLDRPAIADRTGRLAGLDWSSFPGAEQAAFAFARKLTATPREVGERDFRTLANLFGRERALDVIWWSSRCQFMTKVSDAFQLQLERDNVFTDHLKADEGPK